MILDNLIGKSIYIRFKRNSYSSNKNIILLEVNNFGVWIKEGNYDHRFYPYNSIEYISSDNL